MTDLTPAPSTSRFVEANGVQLHYLDYGTAGKRPMLCVHGGAAHAHWFDYIAPGFTRDHHVLSLDLRGHGDSAWGPPEAYSWKTFADDLDAFVEKLDLRDFVLVGHSMGGMVSLVYAATHPGRMARFVVIDTIQLMPMDRVLKMNEFGKRPARGYATQEELVERYRLEPADSQMAAPEVIRNMALNSGRRTPEGRWQHKADRAVYANFKQIAGVPLWEKVKVPALAIRGERSKRFTPKMVDEIRALAPQLQVTQVPASDHHITLDNPPGCIQAIREFLER